MTDFAGDPRVKAIEELVKQVQDAFAREQTLWKEQNSEMMSGRDSGYSAWVQKWHDNHDASRRWAPELAKHLAFLLEDRKRLIEDLSEANRDGNAALDRAEVAEAVARLQEDCPHQQEFVCERHCAWSENDAALLERLAAEKKPEARTSSVGECGKPIPSIPRWGMVFLCTKPRGHEGDCATIFFERSMKRTTTFVALQSETEGVQE